MIFKGMKAFLVDDDPQLLGLLQMNLELNGFICKSTSDPASAAEAASEFNPDIIISDLQMPEVDGFAFRRQVLKNPALSEKPFIFLTSNDDENNQLKGFNLNINDYILKTTSPRVLIKKIETVLQSQDRFEQTVKQDLKKAVSLISSNIDERQEISDKFSISIISRPYKDTPGGDFVEKMQIDDHRAVYVIADVMGKEWEAWFHSFPFRSHIKSAIFEEQQKGKGFDAANVLNALNNMVENDRVINDYSIALTILVIDAEDLSVQASGAGSLPLLKIHAGGAIEEIDPIEASLGFSRKTVYTSQTVPLAPGDKILAFTDGVIESAVNNSLNLYSELKKLLNAYPDYENLLWLEARLKELAGNSVSDDVTLMEITRLPEQH